MPVDFGIMFGVIGCLLTIIGFLIAYTIAGNVIKKEQEKKKPLTSVEQSLQDLNNVKK